MDILEVVIQKGLELRRGYQQVLVFRARFALLNEHLQECIGHFKKAEDQLLKKRDLASALTGLEKLAAQAVELMRVYINRGVMRDFLDAATGAHAAERVEELLNEVSAARERLSTVLQIETYQDAQQIKKMLEVASEKDRQQLASLHDIEEKLKRHIDNSSQNNQMVAFFQRLSTELPDSCVADSSSFNSVLAMLEARLINHDLNSLLYGTEKREFKDIKVLKDRALYVLGETRGVMNSIPQDFMRTEEKDRVAGILKDLQERESRMKDLTLRACFVGPTKSGKSTAINAILGEKIAPSDLQPMTVLPTILRHSAGVHRPVVHLPGLQHYKAAIAALKKMMDKDPELVAAMCGGKVHISKGEMELFQEIKDDEVNVMRSFQDQQVYEKLSDCSAILRRLNHLCRLCSRVNQRDKDANIPNPIWELHEESVRNGKPSWPWIQTQMHLLADSHLDAEGSEVFEIMDTPGRDEMKLIPEIGYVVKRAVADAACCVCVCNASTAFTDAQAAIREELKSSCQFAPAVYLLANKADVVKDRKVKDALKKDLAKDFLGDESQTSMVYPVSAKQELLYATLKTLERKHGRERLAQELKGLSDVDDDDMSELQLQLKEWAQEVYDAGGTDWWEFMDQEWDFHVDSNMKMHKKSQFEPFQHHLMHEVAPNAGRKVIFQHTDALYADFGRFACDLDFIIKAYGADDEEYNDTKYRLERFTEKVNTKLVAGVKEKCSEMKAKARELIFESQASRDCTGTMRELVGQEVDKVKDDHLGQDRLMPSVTQDEIREFNYLDQAWEGKAVWRFFDKFSAGEFEGALRSRAEAVASTVLVELGNGLHEQLKVEVDCLVLEVMKKVEELQDEDEKRELQLELSTLRFPALKLEMEETSVRRSKDVIKEWYLFWIIPMKSKAGEVTCIVHDSEDAGDEALKQALQARCGEATSNSLKDLEEQVIKYVDTLERAFMEQVMSTLSDRKNQLLLLEKRRAERDKSDTLKRFCMARLKLEGLKLDAKIARDCSKSDTFKFQLKSHSFEDLASPKARSRVGRPKMAVQNGSTSVASTSAVGPVPVKPSTVVTEASNPADEACVGCVVPTKSNGSFASLLRRGFSRG